MVSFMACGGKALRTLRRHVAERRRLLSSHLHTEVRGSILRVRCSEKFNIFKAVSLLLLAFNPVSQLRLPGSRVILLSSNPTLARRKSIPMASMAILQEVWLNPEASDTQDLATSIQLGDVVVCAEGIASEAEMLEIEAAGIAAASAQRRNAGKAPRQGRNRLMVSDREAFSSDIVFKCEDILLRVLDALDEQMPSLYQRLFKPCETWASRQPLDAKGAQPTEPPPLYLAETCPTLRDLYTSGELEWSEGEPAINVYTTAGYFGTHKDHLALTAIIPLNSPGRDFSGGGTGFWAGGRNVSENPEGPAAVVVNPPAGTAILFGGDVTHAGMPIDTGVRANFVFSISTRTPASSEDRVGGLQVPPQISTFRLSGFADGMPGVNEEDFDLQEEDLALEQLAMEKTAAAKQAARKTAQQTIAASPAAFVATAPQPHQPDEQLAMAKAAAEEQAARETAEQTIAASPAVPLAPAPQPHQPDEQLVMEKAAAEEQAAMETAEQTVAASPAVPLAAAPQPHQPDEVDQTHQPSEDRIRELIRKEVVEGLELSLEEDAWLEVQWKANQELCDRIDEEVEEEKKQKAMKATVQSSNTDDSRAGNDAALQLTPRERMMELKKLFDDGILTQEEFEEKRAEILQSI